MVQVRVRSTMMLEIIRTAHVESVWTRALLSRTRLTDPIFQEDLLAFISVMATSLRTGLPATGSHGLNVIQKEARKKEAEEDYRDLYPEFQIKIKRQDMIQENSTLPAIIFLASLDQATWRYAYVNTDVGTDFNAATQFTAVHFEEGPLGNVGEYLSPRPSRSHELKSGHTMECVAFAKKESVMKYGPIFVEANAVNDQQKLEKYLADKKFSPKSSVLIAHTVEAERKGELIMYIPGTFISTLGYDPARPAPAVDSLGFYVNCRPVEMMLYQPYKEISQWEELQPRLWVNGMTTMSTLKYPAH
ncbi:hypothetical protein LENED_008452 [Lentinula edodes]|uniref:Uncharacterized protein n=1 Tax=Lentinula edodes TaxID=5353 RepID=A0A1Q3EH53_LENED|nr:hypothetical protein LENED_008452 [Lentinula edodes]